MERKQLAIACPVCGRKNSFPVENLTEGADLVCPLCSMKINLHGHMWEYIRKELANLNTEE